MDEQEFKDLLVMYLGQRASLAGRRSKVKRRPSNWRQTCILSWIYRMTSSGDFCITNPRVEGSLGSWIDRGSTKRSNGSHQLILDWNSSDSDLLRGSKQ
ncbi:hypothetical protein O181_023702 [Austropuccinia psidii MF-1]|uniref:Uncharacterized protein n=1 Tax=Austropuccinia psidii MF-1 TaxID=1389203 RepID=A0A9Q3GY94_9BASI|nr:hypothetical protein [Austropuccinia psidii MF-1]